MAIRRPQFSVRSLLLWTGLLGASVATFRIAWDRELFLLLLADVILLCATICAPIGYFLHGRDGMWGWALFGGLFGFLIDCAVFVWLAWIWSRFV
jgi:hypothetical protein